jgi:hypothetical protein
MIEGNGSHWLGLVVKDLYPELFFTSAAQEEK